MSLQGSMCAGCGRAAVPAEAMCLACGAATEAHAFGAAGTVLACTQRPGRPWVVLVELAGGARVLALWQERDAAGDAVPAVGAVVGLREEDGRLAARLG